jgi:hypothetical protein
MFRSALLIGVCAIATGCSDVPQADTAQDTAEDTTPAPTPEPAEAAPASPQLIAFPGADGFGRYSVGGRGGTVYTVTNLNDSGPGSLREAVEADGPRTVVFAVSGTIQLEDRLTIENDNITIAGQTAPGAGIALRDYPLRINANNVIVRYIRSRIGGESLVEDDSISIVGGSDIIVDHVSTSWAIDEVLSSSQSYRGLPGQKHLTNLTVQWSIISEGLYDAGHEKGDRAYGSLIRGNDGARYSWHHNLWANNHSRMPRIGNYATPFEDPDGLLIDFRNNVFYNWGHGAQTDFWDWIPESADFDPSQHMGLNQPPLYGREGTDYHYAAGTDLDPASVAQYNFVNNAYVQGPDTLGPIIFYMRNATGRAYFAGNTMDGELGEQLPMLRSAAHELSWVDEPYDVVFGDTQTALEAYEAVLNGAGASLWRDAVDERVVNDVRNGTGGIISSEAEVGGWPDLPGGDPRPDSDGDGMPDAWEEANGLDASDPSDGALDRDGDGYTNLEDWLNSLVPAN